MLKLSVFLIYLKLDLLLLKLEGSLLALGEGKFLRARLQQLTQPLDMENKLLVNLA